MIASIFVPQGNGFMYYSDIFFEWNHVQRNNEKSIKKKLFSQVKLCLKVKRPVENQSVGKKYWLHANFYLRESLAQIIIVLACSKTKTKP